MYRMLLVVALVLIFTFAAWANVESLRVDSLTNADITYIQRGWAADIGQCAIDAVYQVIEDGDSDHWILQLSDTDAEIKLSRKDGSSYIVCGEAGMLEVGTGVGNTPIFRIFTPYLN